MNILPKQHLFAQLLPRLIDKAHSLGYDLTIGEVWRPQYVADQNAQPGGVVGISASLHTHKLAVDLNLFRNGAWLMKTDDHRPLGEWWERQSTEGYTCCWGGRFGDGNHYSIEHGGVK